jgi:hypothetical protein
MVFRPGDRITVAAGDQGARLMILGGATLGGPRYIWWNFVASSKERIEEAKRQWRAENWAWGCSTCHLTTVTSTSRCRISGLVAPERVCAGIIVHGTPIQRRA